MAARAECGPLKSNDPPSMSNSGAPPEPPARAPPTKREAPGGSARGVLSSLKALAPVAQLVRWSSGSSSQQRSVSADPLPSVSANSPRPAAPPAGGGRRPNGRKKLTSTSTPRTDPAADNNNTATSSSTRLPAMATPPPSPRPQQRATPPPRARRSQSADALPNSAREPRAAGSEMLSGKYREMAEVQGHAQKLLSSIYGFPVTEEACISILDDYPELTWLANCLRRCPLPPGWHSVEGNLGEAKYVNQEGGEESDTSPLLRSFADLALLMLHWRQDPSAATDVVTALREKRDYHCAEASRTRKVWKGPYVDPESCSEFWHCEATNRSCWGDPGMSFEFLSRVAERLQQALPVDESNALAAVNKADAIAAQSGSPPKAATPGASLADEEDTPTPGPHSHSLASASPRKQRQGAEKRPTSARRPCSRGGEAPPPSPRRSLEKEVAAVAPDASQVARASTPQRSLEVRKMMSQIAATSRARESFNDRTDAALRGDSPDPYESSDGMGSGNRIVREAREGPRPEFRKRRPSCGAVKTMEQLDSLGASGSVAFGGVVAPPIKQVRFAESGDADGGQSSSSAVAETELDDESRPKTRRGDGAEDAALGESESPAKTSSFKPSTPARSGSKLQPSRPSSASRPGSSRGKMPPGTPKPARSLMEDQDEEEDGEVVYATAALGSTAEVLELEAREMARNTVATAAKALATAAARAGDSQEADGVESASDGEGTPAPAFANTGCSMFCNTIGTECQSTLGGTQGFMAAGRLCSGVIAAALDEVFEEAVAGAAEKRSANRTTTPAEEAPQILSIGESQGDEEPSLLSVRRDQGDADANSCPNSPSIMVLDSELAPGFSSPVNAKHEAAAALCEAARAAACKLEQLAPRTPPRRTKKKSRGEKPVVLGIPEPLSARGEERCKEFRELIAMRGTFSVPLSARGPCRDDLTGALFPDGDGSVQAPPRVRPGSTVRLGRRGGA